jgi:integrin beta 3
MTEDDVAAVVEGIAPVVRDFVRDVCAQAAAEIAALSGRLMVAETQLAAAVEGVAPISALRERLAVLETRAPVPGPPGPPGRDGVDGVGFEGLGVEQRDERSFTITAAHGECVKEIGTARFALDLYRGVWTEGRTYEPGDGVTWSGSEWHCQTTTTTKPGEGSKAWTLKVKRGRDGKDGKDGPPGPAGRDWQQVYDDTRRR